MKFGDKLHELRMSAEITLRDFSNKVGMEPHMYSRLERNLLPTANVDLNAIRLALGLNERDQDWQYLIHLSNETEGMAEVTISEAELVGLLPAFLPPGMSDVQLNALSDAIRAEHEYHP